MVFRKKLHSKFLNVVLIVEDSVGVKSSTSMLFERQNSVQAMYQRLEERSLSSLLRFLSFPLESSVPMRAV